MMVTRSRFGFLGLLSVLASGAVSAQTAPVKTKTFSPFMTVVPWFSFKQPPGAVEKRLGMRAEAEPKTVAEKGVEAITVYGARRAPTEDALHRDDPTAESWHSDAAQSYVPGMGDSCSYKSGCFDNAQPGLLSSLPKLFGGD